MGMSYLPIKRKHMINILDQREVFKGYRSGIKGLPLPDNCSYSFWYGWTNSMMEFGSIPYKNVNCG